MTGPGPGKIPLEAAVYLSNGEKIELGGAQVYIHVKGYSLARVTHLDIEHEGLDGLLPAGGGRFLSLRGIDGGIEIKLERKSVLIKCGLLNSVLESGRKTRTWVGGKEGGIYIGFRKAEVEKLEKIALERFGIKPRKYVE